jgi:hypothetical protein
MIFIFDLDGTVIDTSHRYRDLPCGNIDLEYWFANSTEEQIARDTLLPIANVMRRYYNEGHTIVVCTARDFTPNPKVPLADPGATYTQFMADNDLPYHALLHRAMVPGHLTMCDGDLKTILLDEWAAREGLPSDWRKDACMFDDNRKVIAKMLKDRLMCIDAIMYNERLAA